MTGTTGRQDAYRARTRDALLKSAQQVLADIGLSATIEELARQGSVSPPTIYSHFESKEAYLKEALASLWDESLHWAHAGREPGQDLETVIDVCRRLFRLDRTQSLVGRVMVKNLGNSISVFDIFRPSAGAAFKSASQKSGLEVKDFDLRLDVWTHSVLGIFQGVFVTQKLSPKDADKALRISLLLFGLDEAQAERLTSKPINMKNG